MAWIIFGVVVVGFLTSLVIYSYNSTPHIDTSKINANVIQKASVVNGNIADHTFGLVSSKVTLIEYGDFECPYCGEAYAQVKSITTQYQNQIDFIFRNFPLTTIHPNAEAAAAVAEAAGLQGQYWNMHDLLYTSQSSWQDMTGSQRDSYFVGLAKQLKLNVTKFNSDLAGTPIQQKIEYDQAIGNKLGVNSTPSFYLNGKALSQSVISGLEDNSGGTALISLLNADLRAIGVTPPTS